MNGYRRTGYLPDPAGLMRASWHAPASSLPGAVSLEVSALAAVKKHFDQGDTSSCTGHAVAAAIATAFQVAGAPLPFVPSPDEIYRYARCVDRTSVHVRLEDIGARPNQVVRAVKEFGVRPMRPLANRWSDASSEHVNDEPTLEDVAKALQTLVIGERAIYTTGRQRLTDIKTALASGFPITAAVNGGCEAFQMYSSGVLTGAELAGGNDHYVWLCGYDGNHVVAWNSWGNVWGIDGNAILDRTAVDTLSDLYVFIPALGDPT